MMDDALLSILACPETKKDLELASDDLVKKINQAIEQGTLLNRSKEKVEDPVQTVLLRQGDDSVAYPVRHDIPILLVDELLLIDNIQ